MQLVRTTVRIDKDLLLAAKKKALEEDTTLQSFIKQAILTHLHDTHAPSPEFDDKDMGYQLNRPLRRRDLY
jgi:hypothetical protein